MGNLYNALNGLKTNIFGGGNTGKTTPILRKSAIGINETSPTSKLDHDPFEYSSIQYPRDLTSTSGIGHYMLFYVNVQDATKYVYEGTDGAEVGKTVSVTDTWDKPYPNYIVKGNDPQRFKYHENLQRRGKKGFTGNSDAVKLAKEQRPRGSGMSSYNKTTKRITDSVAIYLPPNVQDTTTATYEGAATGVVGAAAAGGMNVLANLGKKDYEAAAKGLVGAAKALVGEAALKAGTEIVEAISGTEGTRGLINKAFGQADNPYMEVLFSQMELRTFTYNFTFAPRNEGERDDVQKIIALFRFHMSPELKGAANRFLTLPSEFDIHYMYQDQSGQASENDYYNKIATCVCTACDVNYAPDGVKSFEDGSPTKITMSLAFQETELLTKERVNQGF